MPWVAIPYKDKNRREELTNLFNIKAIPALIITDSMGEMITADARSEINEDLEGLVRDRFKQNLNPHYSFHRKNDRDSHIFNSNGT